MKLTNANKKAFVKAHLASDPKWAVKALVRIFQENQTRDEQVRDTVVEDNGIGFTGADGELLSSLAKQYIAKGFLSEKQLAHVLKKMPKY